MAARILVVDRTHELSELVRSATAILGPGVQVRNGTVDELDRHDVAVIGPATLTAAGLRRLADLHRQAPTTAIVLITAGRPAGSLRDLIRVGADDVLALPCPEDELVLTLERVLALAARRRPAACEKPAPAGRVITVTSGSGGAGKTFLATNTAHFLARQPDQRVVLVDLDLQFGEIAPSLKLDPELTIADAVRLDDAQLEAHLDSLLVRHPDGFSVLAAPLTPAEADWVTPDQVARILRALRARADHVVVDTPTGLTETVLTVLDVTDRVYALTNMDLPSIRSLTVFLKMLERLGVPAERTSLVLNKEESGVGLDVGEVARLFPGGFQAVLPYDREVSRALNEGVPVLAASPDSPASRLLVKLLLELVPEDQRAAVRAAAKGKRVRPPRRQAAPAVAPSPPVPPPDLAPPPATVTVPLDQRPEPQRAEPEPPEPEPAGPEPTEPEAPEAVEVDLRDERVECARRPRRTGHRHGSIRRPHGACPYHFRMRAHQERAPPIRTGPDRPP